jgi:hypothetical protein
VRLADDRVVVDIPGVGMFSGRGRIPVLWIDTRKPFGFRKGLAGCVAAQIRRLKQTGLFFFAFVLPACDISRSLFR